MIIGTMRKQKTFCTDKVRQGTLNSGTVCVTDRGVSRFEKNRTEVVAIRSFQCTDRSLVSCLASFHVGVITVKYFNFPACWSAYIYMIDKRSIIANRKSQMLEKKVNGMYTFEEVEEEEDIMK